MSEPFEAAVRAGCARYTILRALDCNATKACPGAECECGLSEAIAVALRAALPPDPAPETRQIMEKAIWGHCGDLETIQGAAIAAYRALRASLLPGEEPS